MIVSASRRTDIPAFFSEWFVNRIRAGFFYRVNPFNAHQVSGFSLKPDDVDAVCFWTKNPRPLMAHLDEIDRRGFNYYFQFTLNPYSPTFEPHLPPLAERIATFRELATRIGPQRMVWRYDPVILTSATPVEWHLEAVEKIAAQLSGATCRLVFSFYDFYGKGEGRLHAALQGSGITLHDITAAEYANDLQGLAQGFKAVADCHQLRLLSCSEGLNLSPLGIEHGACIDGGLIREVFGVAPTEKKDKNQRPACRCMESVDMGSYNTCSFGCAYCYANFNDGTIAGNLRRHDVHSPALLGNFSEEIPIRRSLDTKKTCNRQPSPF